MLHCPILLSQVTTKLGKAHAVSYLNFKPFSLAWHARDEYRLLSVQRVPTVIVVHSATGQKVTPLGMEGIERAMAMTAGDDAAVPIDNLVDAWRVGGSGVGWTDQCLIS